ncbi:MAG: glucose-6-phosphate dehydrogenase (NADP(+)) [Actinobacteria bacterium]|nr:glucose-6-phosphate dehydrogenase (NADP(+)) [Actinomycetota bacterium]
MLNKSKINFPFTLIIFGATGDLFINKLSGSLLNLYSKGLLPELFQIIGISKEDYNTAQFRKFLKKELQKSDKKHSHKVISNFLNNIFYFKGFFEDPETYESIKKSLAPKNNNKFAICLNKLYYLAVPPKYYDVILKKLSDSGLTDSCEDKAGWNRILVEKPFGSDIDTAKKLSDSGLTDSCEDKAGWNRILVEKPFGSDIDTAKKLDDMLGQLFKEGQIFRIDHYLAKDIIQNIIFFRFSNVIFDPIWNNSFIEKIEIKLLEKTDINNRGSFYDSIGALRDVGQNHILQMLALIAMNDPGSINASSIRKERANVLKTLVPIDNDNLIKKYTVRGQYEGYKKSKDVSINSNTETYFKIKAFLGSSRWKNVPFYLESGKALKEKKTEIIIYFREKCICSEAHKKYQHKNLLIIKIFPKESILVRFWAKNPGLIGFPEPRDFEFSYHERIGEHIEEYDKVILDCLKGDQTLFLSTEEEKYAWKFITPILNKWNNIELHKYKKGSLGPKIEI